MTQLQKYTWLIDTIRRAGNISHRELSERWENCRQLSDGRQLYRATFNRWREAIADLFGIVIACQRTGGYLYHIENPEALDTSGLKKWMLDSFAVGNIIGDNLQLKDRMIVEPIPSGRDHLTAILEAMKDNSVVSITYRAFSYSKGYDIRVAPYCVRLFDGRWYVLGHNLDKDTMRIYALDRIERLTLTHNTFRLPKDFSSTDYFNNYYGIVVDPKIKPVRIVIRANNDHAPYLKTLPLHHSQQLIDETETHADFELHLAPTYDFIMRLLHVGAMIEVLSPVSLRHVMKSWIDDMHDLYRND